jgi:hypothetical protein
MTQASHMMLALLNYSIYVVYISLLKNYMYKNYLFKVIIFRYLEIGNAKLFTTFISLQISRSLN